MCRFIHKRTPEETTLNTLYLSLLTPCSAPLLFCGPTPSKQLSEVLQRRSKCSPSRPEQTLLRPMTCPTSNMPLVRVHPKPPHKHNSVQAAQTEAVTSKWLLPWGEGKIIYTTLTVDSALDRKQISSLTTGPAYKEKILRDSTGILSYSCM